MAKKQPSTPPVAPPEPKGSGAGVAVIVVDGRGTVQHARKVYRAGEIIPNVQDDHAADMIAKGLVRKVGA